MKGINEISVTTGPNFTSLVHARHNNSEREIEREMLVPNTPVFKFDRRKTTPEQKEHST